MSKDIWSKELIIEKILERHKNGLSLSTKYILKEDSKLFNNAKSKRYFGSWRNAIEATGLNYNEIKEAKIRENGKFIQINNSLISTHPDLAKEWHPYLNGDLTPNDITATYVKRVWWLCPNGHEWQRSVSNRTFYDNTCPKCKSLAFLFPELVKQWHPTKNGELSPWDFFASSDKKVWWQCEKGHEWYTKINKRTIGRGCHECKSGTQTSFPEQAIFYYIKNIFIDALNRHVYQVNVDKYEIDIYIPSLKFGIEYDGGKSHKNRKNDDEKKNIALIKNGIKLIRIREGNLPELSSNGDVVIVKQIKRNDNELSKVIKIIFEHIANIYKMTNLKLDIDIHRDKFYILDNILKEELENSLEKQNHELAEEWHPSKNGNLKPEHVAPYSNIEVWWKCENGHEWMATPGERNNNGRKKKCGRCLGIVVSNTNNLALTHPKIARQWHPTKNNEITPDQVLSSSRIRAWWICDCGKEFPMAINYRTQKQKEVCCKDCNLKIST